MMCGKRFSVAKFTPLLALITSSTRARSSPACFAASMTSAVAARLTALRKLFSTLVVCPAPLPPMCTTLPAIGPKTQPIESSAAAEPPTMMVSVPFSAAAAPPEMPASRYSIPRPASSPCSLMVELGVAVLRSTTTWAARPAASRPPSPLTTDSTAALSGRDSRMQSLPSATSAREEAGVAPAAAARPGTGSKPSTGWPAPTSRRVIRPPMFPRPTKPIRCVLTSVPPVRTGRNPPRSGQVGRPGPAGRPSPLLGAGQFRAGRAGVSRFGADPHREPGQLAGRALGQRREPPHHVRIMPGDQLAGAISGQCPQRLEAGVHRGQVRDMPERAVELQLLVVVQGIRGEHRLPLARADQHDQLARRMAADLDDLEAVRDRLPPADETDPAVVPRPAQDLDVGTLRGGREERPGRQRAGAEVVLTRRHDDLSGRERGQVADVVIVRVRRDQQADIAGRDAQPLQRRHRWAQHRPPAPRATPLVEAAVDQHGA